MSGDGWDALDGEMSRINADDSFKPLRPLVEALQALVGARQPDVATAKLLLHAINSVHKGQVKPEDLVNIVQGTNPGISQPDWDVDTVYQAKRDVVVKLVVGALPQLKKTEPGIFVPIVLVAMTANEAADLASGSAFSGHPGILQNDFSLLSTHLASLNLADWQQHYKARPEDWVPFGGDTQTIAEFSASALDLLSGESGKTLAPRFFDVRTLNKNRPTLQLLRSQGCVVIIDTISIRHPALLAAFQRTLLDAYPGTAVLTLAPHDESFKLIRSMVYSLQLRLIESELNSRMTDPLEPFGVCQKLTEMEEFPRWLVTRAKQICKKALADGGIRSDMSA